ncbi:enoyl-CoA hydratase-related protein [Streptomyces sp. 11-1-2]|uniref:enoyl-CoA hydratase-related protein n=1 Tax=unclassified Streptomyces TaxID=2593676 RepID=UPI001F098D9B|nr:enoyl-CoA hydratase-related protein [Streptomyces sp. 11-1-2]
MTVTDTTPVTSPEAGTVEIERTGEHHDIAVLTLRRERKLNALSTHLESVLLDALRSQEVRTSRAVVVTGVPRAFSAGADTGELREMTPEAVWIVALRWRVDDAGGGGGRGAVPEAGPGGCRGQRR